MKEDDKGGLHNRIVQLHRGGSSIRGIARQLGISRRQVARVLAAHQADRNEGSRGELPRPKQKRASSLDEYQERLAQLLARYSRSAIERILAIQATPKTALDTLAEKEQQQLKSLLGDEPVRPRSGKDYQELLDKQTNEAHDAAQQPNAEQDAENRGQDDAGQDSGSNKNGDEDDDSDCAGVA